MSFCQALKPLHHKEKEGLMHLHLVRMFSACDLALKHPGRATVCRKRVCSLSVNESFPALVIKDNTPAMNSQELD
eukprot:12404261-Prorocentrum_lima.AAC.1